MDSPKKETSGSGGKQYIAVDNVEVMQEQSKKDIEQTHEEIDVLQKLISLNERKLALEIDFLLALQDIANIMTDKKPDREGTYIMKRQREAEDDDL